MRWEIFILGYHALYAPGTRHLWFFGPKSGAAWPVACRLAKRLGATITARGGVRFTSSFIRDNDLGLKKLWEEAA